MSAEHLIQVLNKILVLHENLFKLSEQKTDILKKGDIDALGSHMKEEQKYILAIRQLEEQRIAVVEKMLGRNEKEYTLSRCIELAVEPEKTQLTNLYTKLTTVVHDLKELNQLNQQLAHQSLQFVNVSLDMLLPHEQSVNYGNPTGTQEKKQSRSMFDSKA